MKDPYETVETLLTIIKISLIICVVYLAIIMAVLYF